MKADLNVFDLERMAVLPPRLVDDNYGTTGTMDHQRWTQVPLQLAICEIVTLLTLSLHRSSNTC